MDADGDRDHDDRHRGDGSVEKAPLAGGPGPAEGQGTIEPSPARQMVAQDRDVGDERQVEVDRAGRQIGRDRSDVPQQGRSEVAVPQDVEHAVGPAQIQDHAAHAEEEDQDGDHLGGARDRAPPFRVRQPQDRRDQRAGVADADEEDEVGDVEAPVDRHVETGHGEAPAQLARVGEDAPRRDQQQDGRGGPERTARSLDGAQQADVLAELKLLHPILLSTGRRPSAGCPALRAAGRRAVPATSG